MGRDEWVRNAKDKMTARFEEREDILEHLVHVGDGHIVEYKNCHAQIEHSKVHLRPRHEIRFVCCLQQRLLQIRSISLNSFLDLRHDQFRPKVQCGEESQSTAFLCVFH